MITACSPSFVLFQQWLYFNRFHCSVYHPHQVFFRYQLFQTWRQQHCLPHFISFECDFLVSLFHTPIILNFSRFAKGAAPYFWDSPLLTFDLVGLVTHAIRSVMGQESSDHLASWPLVPARQHPSLPHGNPGSVFIIGHFFTKILIRYRKQKAPSQRVSASN